MKTGSSHKLSQFYGLLQVLLMSFFADPENRWCHLLQRSSLLVSFCKCCSRHNTCPSNVRCNGAENYSAGNLMQSYFMHRLYSYSPSSCSECFHRNSLTCRYSRWVLLIVYLCKLRITFFQCEILYCFSWEHFLWCEAQHTLEPTSFHVTYCTVSEIH